MFEGPCLRAVIRVRCQNGLLTRLLDAWFALLQAQANWSGKCAFGGIPRI